MDYTQLYYSIVEPAKSRTIDTYTEKHHIIPRSLGGTDDKCNIVSLTAKEHFVCHLLLTKMYPEGSFEWHKMIKAFMMMQSHSSRHKRYTGKLHENYRVRFSQVQSESQRGEKNSNFGTMWIHNMELEKSKKISKTEAIPEGWQKGRVLDFSKKKTQKRCVHCDNFVIRSRPGKYCSTDCKLQSISALRSVLTQKVNCELLDISTSYNIVSGTVVGNADFIKYCVNCGFSTRAILHFLKCNDSGANYNTLEQIMLA